MANTLSEFIQHIKKNSIARMNRFRIQFTLPDLVASKSDYIGDNVEKTMSLTCLVANIPSETMQTTTISYGNFDRKVTYGRSLGDFSTTFLVTGKYLEKKVFDVWVNTVIDEDNHAIQYYNQYITNIHVECLNEQDEVMYRFEITEAYPTFVSDIKLDRTTQNQQMVLDVTWAYFKCDIILDNVGVNTSATAQPSGLPAIPGPGSAIQRLLPVPGIDQMSSAVQSAVSTVKGFQGQLQSVLDMTQSVKEQVRDFKMSVMDGVRTLNRVVKDVKSIKNIPTDVKNEVVNVVVDNRNELGYLKDEVNNINNYPKR